MTGRTAQAARVVSQRIDGHTMLLAPGHEAALHLDEVATTVWTLLAGSPTFDELVGQMVAHYAATPEQVAADLRPVLAILRRHGVVVEIDGSSLRVALLDSVIEVQGPAEVIADLARLYPRGAAPATAIVRVEPAGASWRVSERGEVLPALTATAARETVAMFLNRVALRECASFAVHAGAVARDGAVLALPASSGAGKSTLTAALVRHGWRYVSDEALVLSTAGEVRTYPRPLSLHAWTLRRLGLPVPGSAELERLVHVGELGGAVAHGPLRLRHVVQIARGSTNAVGPRPRAEAATTLLRYGFNHFRDPAGAFRVSAEAATGSTSWHLDVADPLEAAELLSSVLD